MDPLTSAAPVRALPPRTASLVRSQATVPSLAAILQELVHNSLDATARTVHCAVDLDTWTLRCDDSGSGIPPPDLALLASAARSLTSKLPIAPDATANDLFAGIETYGFRGEALASLQDLATVEIRTKAALGSDGTTHELVLRDGECLSRGVSRVERAGHGTTVVVRDIFNKLPVRRRPLSKPSAQATVLSSLRSTLSSIALLHPDVAFSLTDTTSSPSSLSSEPRTLLSVGRSSTGLVGRWKQLWGRAGVEHVVEFDEVEPAVGARDGARMRARGFFSLSAAHSKSGQHVFVNSRHLAPATSPLHKLLNTLFASSSFARHASSHLSFPASSPASSPARAAAAASRGKSPKKVAERHSVFVVVLDVPGRVVDVSLEPEKRVVEFEDLPRVEAFVSLIARRFLTSQGFLSSLPPSPPARSRPPPYSPARHQPLKRPRSASPTVGDNIESAHPPKRLAASASSVAPASTPLRMCSATLPPQQSPSAGPTAHPLGAGARDEYAEKVGGPQRWVDPATHEVWEIDPRTGNSWRAGGRSGEQEGGQGECAGCERGGRVDRRALRTSEGTEETKEDMPEWLQKSLEKWQNPVFPAPPVNSEIPTLPSLVPGDGPSNHVAAVPLKKRSSRSMPSSAAPLTRSTRKAMSSFFSTASGTSFLSEPAVPDLPRLSRLGTPAPSASPAPLAAPPAPLGTSQQTLSRASLQHSAEYLAQVDAKYLLVKLASTLVLVDQHAASERIRVESFLASLVGRVARGEPPDVRRLSRDARIGVVVGRAEARAVRERWSAEFARWGLELEFDDRNEPSQAGGGGEEGEYHQLWLATVPALLHARLSTEPRTAQDLVRSFVAQLEEHGPMLPPPPPQRSEAGDWVAALRGAPPVLKELLDSKACRGAIMFNDVLTPEQGRALVTQLAQTRFPFQCAHGRPSLVPVVNLANDDAARRARWDEVDWSRFD